MAAASDRRGGESVCAVVVTHNRRDALRRCLSAIAAQSRPPDRVMVVDNASDDDTKQMVATEFPAVELCRLERNEGGAGGFYAGLRQAYARGAAWLWLMDDDTVPAEPALERLLAGAQTGRSIGAEPIVLASRVVWQDGRLHPMNLPFVRLREVEGLVEAAAHGLVGIRAASLVSLLVHRRAVERYGLPVRRYFIWCDDAEFTARILRAEIGYLVLDSVVRHATDAPHVPAESAPARYFYFVRNTVYMVRGQAWAPLEKARLLRHLVRDTRQFLARNHWRWGALAVVGRAVWDGLVTPAHDGEPIARSGAYSGDSSGSARRGRRGQRLAIRPIGTMPSSSESRLADSESSD